MRLTDITHVGRALDPRHPNTRIGVVVPVLAGIIVLVVERELGIAVAAGLGTFAAWAIARELDPDRPDSAVVAAVLAAVATVTLGPPAPAALFVTLLTVRILARTTGLPPKTSDLAVITAGAILFADTPWGWAAGILLAFAMVRDAALPGDLPPNAGVWGALLAVGVTARVALADGLGVWDVPALGTVLVLVLGLAGAAVVLRPVPVLSLGDFTKTPLEPSRIREAALFGALTAVLGTVAAGHSGIVRLAPLLLVYVAVATVRLLRGQGDM